MGIDMGLFANAGLPAALAKTPVAGPMTEPEARACVVRIRDHCERIRGDCESAGALILELREREGWKALGYCSWRECAAAELGLSMSRIYQLAAHAEISTIVENARLPAPNEAQARELAALPPEEQVDRWCEALANSNGKPTARVVAEVVGRRQGSTLLQREQDATRNERDDADDFQTPAEGAAPLLDYLPTKWAVWECAEGQGNLSATLRTRGHRVTGSDVRSGQDFLTWKPDSSWDCVVTNPPYSKKDEFLARCYALGKPFALLMPVAAVGEQGRMNLYREHGIQLLLPDKRINFQTPTGGPSSAWFFTAWFCWQFDLPRDLIFWRRAHDGDDE
jgi:hypothetical protein